MGYGSNGINTNGTCMNTGNQLNASRPSIRLYPGVSSGGSFASFCGGGPEQRGKAATKIMNEMQQPVRPLQEQNTVVINNKKPLPDVGYSQSALRQPVAHATQYEQPAPVERQQPAYANQAPKPTTLRAPGASTATGTSLSFGSENAVVRNGRRRGRQSTKAGEVPDWMSGGTTQHRAIDCSPPTSDHESDGSPEPAMSREEFSRHYDAQNNQNHANRRVPGLEDKTAGKKSMTHDRLGLGDGVTGLHKDVSAGDVSRMRHAAEARMKSRPF
eukprot:TRINITY_DN3489_c0_g1_i4.p1 TRINITY_DN3489_c0_g1~~TRINITY_DN3489_c0_g1_i4.p1  ORF type:complete len:272 (+),score=56.91 TRINITY_DN3489_c0_g1_i4:179-994(+)